MYFFIGAISLLLALQSNYVSAQVPQAEAPTQITIPCINDDGKLVGASADYCQAIAPKCSVLRSNYEEKIKDLLSWKIYGFYQGKDLDLEHTTPDQLVGTDMPYPICSVVGHTMKFGGSNGDLEIENQSSFKKLSCGKRPLALGDNKEKSLELRFSAEHGSLWNSYLLGAYPWIIRKNAYDVLHDLSPDLSNINDVVKSPSMKKAFATFGQNMNGFYTDLGRSSKEICAQKQTDVEKKCLTGGFKITDPSARICQLVKAQVTTNTGALPNLLLAEIMARVHTQYDGMFGAILAHKSEEFKAYFSECQNEGSSQFHLDLRRPYSCAASCLFGGEEFYTFQDYSVEESHGRGNPSRHCTKKEPVGLKDGRVPKSSLFGTGAKSGGDRSVNFGFAGFVEYLIRTKVCGQAKVSDDNVCDQVQIPDKPKSLK